MNIKWNILGLTFLLIAVFSNCSNEKNISKNKGAESDSLLDSNSSNTSMIEDYYKNEYIFNIDTVYTDVLIDGKSFKIKILSDKSEEYLGKNREPDPEIADYILKTIVIYSDETGKIAYVKKFDDSKPHFVKQCGNLSKKGKLYLHWMNSGGGSGFTSNTSIVSIVDGKIAIEKIFNSCELDCIYFNKNDNEIYIFKGIWGSYKGHNGELLTESHFEDHRYDILQYRFEQNKFHENKIGITKNKYSDSDDLLKKIIQNENIPSGKINHREYVYFNNYSGEILVK